MAPGHRAALPALFAPLLVSSGFALAGIPSPSHSDCALSVVQAPCVRPTCLSAAPPIVRLCPQGDFDRATFDLVVRDETGQPIPDVLVLITTLSPTVRLNPSVQTDRTDSEGRATVDLEKAAGFGRAGVCADGIVLCEIEVRTFDVAGGSLPSQCPLTQKGSTIVNVSDVTNSACGFLSKFGLVTPGVNNSWDLNCDGNVNGTDLNGTLCPPCGRCGSWYTHSFHGGTVVLGSCP